MKAYAIVANGTEEAELLVVVDILKRAGMEVELTSIHNESTITSSHGITIKVDNNIDNTSLSDADLIFIPGGMPGSKNISECGNFINKLKKHYEKGKRIAAICAAPGIVLGLHGLLNGKKYTCFPGFEQYVITNSTLVHEPVVTDGLISTGVGLGAAIDLGLELVKLLISEDKSKQIKEQIQYK